MTPSLASCRLRTEPGERRWFRRGGPAGRATRGTGMATTIYDIRIREALDEQWAVWFDPLTLTHTRDGQTALCGSLPDQAALHGILNRIAHLGLTLLSVGSTTEDMQ